MTLDDMAFGVRIRDRMSLDCIAMDRIILYDTYDIWY